MICACVKTQHITNFCSSRLADPSTPANQRHLSAMDAPGLGINQSRSLLGSQGGVRGAPGGAFPSIMMVIYNPLLFRVLPTALQVIQSQFQSNFISAASVMQCNATPKCFTHLTNANKLHIMRLTHATSTNKRSDLQRASGITHPPSRFYLTCFILFI